MRKTFNITAVMLPFILLLPSPAAGQSRQDEIALLRAQIAQQQKNLELLSRKLEALERPAAPAAAPATAPATPTTQVDQAKSEPARENLLAGDGKPYSPLSFRIGGAEFTPGGFAELITVFRSTNTNGIGTNFGAIPLKNTPAGQLTELRMSAQNSRITLKTEARREKDLLTGYLEADFLGTQPGNIFVTSNSNTFRMRLYWFNVQRSKFEILAGQSWTLLTPNRKGISAMPGDLFYTQAVDTNYQVGLTWARQAQLRAVYHPNSNWTAAVSLENPQQYVNSSVLPAFFANQADSGNNPSAPNLRPDVIAKVAWDGKAGGRAMHVEAAGLWRSFRTVRPDGRHSSIEGAGAAVNANLELFKNFRFIANTFYSAGGGRYLFGLGPDFIVRPDGALSPVHSMSAVAGFEYQANPETLIYAYYGGAYFRRNYSVDAEGQFSGFGFPGSPNTANRSVQEPTLDYIRTFWRNPNYGALLLNVQYSYLTRSPWSPPPGARNAHSHMVFTDLRYVLP